MMTRFFFLICFGFLFVADSYCQLTDKHALWGKLCYINDTLRSASESDLNALLKIESSEKKMLSHPDSAYTYLLSAIGHLYYEQGDYLKGAQYYRRAIVLIHSGIDKPWMKPAHLFVFYYRLSSIYDSLNQVS